MAFIFATLIFTVIGIIAWLSTRICCKIVPNVNLGSIHLALKKLEEGCNIEGAMAVCEPGILERRCKDMLRVYLAPFLQGMQYTSLGRHFTEVEQLEKGHHFTEVEKLETVHPSTKVEKLEKVHPSTKVEKLEKVVDKLQWYVEDGDTIVDFCCGENDFSCLVKERLDGMGKRKCTYKNYDICQPKNEFNFEKRNWITDTPKDLPSGSQLIIGLNPPFGKRAALANMFIAKALQLKPKLIVLIVPQETERLDNENKETPYDLIWEDPEFFAAKPKTDLWNNPPPPLYLWSHPDWTNRHQAIAQQHGHV